MHSSKGRYPFKGHSSYLRFLDKKKEGPLKKQEDYKILYRIPNIRATEGTGPT